MKISSIKFNGLTSEKAEKSYQFGSFTENTEKIFFEVDQIPFIINYVFLNHNEGIRCDGSAEITFKVKSVDYIITKTKMQGKDSVALRQIVNGKSQRLPKPYEELGRIFECDASQSLAGCVIDSKEFKKFEENPSIFHFEVIRKMKDGAEKLAKAYDKIAEQANQAQRGIKELSKGAKIVTEEQVREASQAWSSKENEYLALLETIKNLENEMLSGYGNTSLKKELETNEKKIAEFLKDEESVDDLRNQIKEHNKVQKLIPMLQEVLAYRRTQDDIVQRTKENKQKLETLAQQKEESVAKLGEINDKLKGLIEKSSQLVIVKEEAEPSSVRMEEDLNAELVNLQEEKEQLEKQLEAHAADITHLDTIIEKIGNEIKNKDMSVNSFSELMESVRAGERLSELQRMLEENECDTEITNKKLSLKEAEIETYENELKRLLELDKAFAPFKSRKQVKELLRAKVYKNEYMLKSLSEKELELEEEVKDLTAKESEVDAALEVLRADLKNKEFSRERFIKKPVSDEKAADGEETLPAATPRSTAFLDMKVETVRQEINLRIETKMEIISEKVGLQYALREIRRQKSIAAGEIAAGIKQQQELELQLNGLDAESLDETTEVYIRALKEDSPVAPLLDCQKRAAKAQAELEMLKQEAENELKRKEDLCRKISELEESASSSQQLKDQIVEEQSFTEKAQKLIVAQNERNRQSESMRETERKLFSVENRITQCAQSRAVPDKEESEGTYTKEQADKLKQEHEAELSETFKAKSELENEISRLDSEIIAEKTKGAQVRYEIQRLKNESGGKKELATKLVEQLQGESIQSIQSKNLSKENLTKITKSIEKFDTTLTALRKKSDAIRLKLTEDQSNSPEREQLKKRLDAENFRKDKLLQELAVLKKKMSDAMMGYLSSSKQKINIEKMSSDLENAQRMKEVLKESNAAQQMYMQNITAYAKAAGRDFSLLTKGLYGLGIKGDLVIVDIKSKKPINFSELSAENRYMAYAALNSALPVLSNGGRNETLVLKGAVDANSREIMEKFKSLDKVFVTKVN